MVGAGGFPKMFMCLFIVCLRTKEQERGIIGSQKGELTKRWRTIIGKRVLGSSKKKVKMGKDLVETN